jgi:hypothetical protein
MRFFIWPVWSVVFLASQIVQVYGQDIHHHPGESTLVDMFYSTWFRPDIPSSSCCNKKDCYVPEYIKHENGELYFLRREDRVWTFVPKEAIEQKRHDQDKVRESPDGRNHVCAVPPDGVPGNNPNFPKGQVFCFTYGIQG